MQAIKRGVLAATLFGAVAVGTWGYSPGVARADTDMEGFVLFVGGTVTTASATLVFGTADVVYGVQGEWLPPVWAGFQLGLGAVPLFVLGAGLFWGSSHSFYKGIGIGHFVVGTWFLTHGILSLIFYEPTDDDADEKTKPSASIDFGITPIEGGAMGALFGKF